MKLKIKEKFVAELLKRDIEKAIDFGSFCIELEYDEFQKEHPELKISRKEYLHAYIKYAKKHKMRIEIDFNEDDSGSSVWIYYPTEVSETTN